MWDGRRAMVKRPLPRDRVKQPLRYLLGWKSSFTAKAPGPEIVKEPMQMLSIAAAIAAKRLARATSAPSESSTEGEQPEEDVRDTKSESCSEVASWKWETIEAETDSAESTEGTKGVVQEAPRPKCAACRGRHRPHTCGKTTAPNRPSLHNGCLACAGRHRPHTCSKATANAGAG